MKLYKICYIITDTLLINTVNSLIYLLILFFLDIN